MKKKEAWLRVGEHLAEVAETGSYDFICPTIGRMYRAGDITLEQADEMSADLSVFAGKLPGYFANNFSASLDIWHTDDGVEIKDVLFHQHATETRILICILLSILSDE